ncbi:MAG: TRL-like family protein [Alphaproteobacteria bacterium]
MKKSILVALAGAIALGGCSSVPSNLGFSFIQDTQEARLVTDASVASKRGEACGEKIISLIAQGDSSIDAAKRNGGITQVTSVDMDIYSIGPFYSKVCTIVRGN